MDIRLKQLEKINKQIEQAKTFEELAKLQLAGEMLIKAIENTKKL